MFDDKKPVIKQEQNHELDLRSKDASHQSSFWRKMKIEIALVSQKLWQQTGFENKTLWDWLQLAVGVAVPVVIFFAGQAIQQRNQAIANANRAQEIAIATANREQEMDIAEDTRNQEILSTYLEDVTNLLIDNDLRHSDDEEVRIIARIKTLNTVRRLKDDGESKGQLLKFLYEANLICKC